MNQSEPSEQPQSLSPRDFAVALGVSESSVKRWVDAGQILANRTMGGHRRILVSEAVRHVRARRLALVKPEILGLEAIPSERDRGSARDLCRRLDDLLTNGHEIEARGLIVSLFLDGQSVAEIIDGPVGAALRRIGELYKESEDSGIFVEHRASEIVHRALHEIQLLLPEPSVDVTAIGGAVVGDKHLLPTLAASIVLEGEGIRTTSLGADTPFTAIYHAIEQCDPHLVWLSVCHVHDRNVIEDGVQKVLELVEARSRFLVLGGTAVGQIDMPSSRSIYFANRMTDLMAFARALSTNS